MDPPGGEGKEGKEGGEGIMELGMYDRMERGREY